MTLSVYSPEVLKFIREQSPVAKCGMMFPEAVHLTFASII